MQPVSMLMSNLNVTNTSHHAPNAMAAAQDTGQSQEIIRDGVRVVQTVQASEAAAEAQRVHRKRDGEKQNEQRDNYEHTEQKEHKNAAPEIAETIREIPKSKKKIEFYA